MESITLDNAKTAINTCTSLEKIEAAKYALSSIPATDLSALDDAVLELEILIASLKNQ